MCNPHFLLRGLTIDSSLPSFPPFEGSDFLMEEIDEFLEHDDSIPPGVDGIYDPEGDTVYLEELLSVINSDPNLPPSPVCEINVPEKGINPLFANCKTPLDSDGGKMPNPYSTSRRVNPKILEVIMQEVSNVLDAGNFYPILPALDCDHDSFGAFPSYEAKRRLEIRFRVERKLGFLRGVGRKELGERNCNTSKNVSQQKYVRERYFIIQQHKIQENGL
ncbi:hypothetical protein Tco_0231437 [Tanacetum coccineum]